MNKVGAISCTFINNNLHSYNQYISTVIFFKFHNFNN